MILNYSNNNQAFPAYLNQSQEKMWGNKTIKNLNAFTADLPLILHKIPHKLLNEAPLKVLTEVVDTSKKIYILMNQDCVTPLLLLQKILRSQKNCEIFVQEIQHLLTSLDEEIGHLKYLPHNQKIFGNVEQIPVLNQNADGTSSGFENCGYHALKNGFLMQKSEGDLESIEKTFNDPTFFKTFYQIYCNPSIKEQSTGKKDATLPLLRQIVEKVQSIDLEKIALLSASSSDGTPEGKPVLGFFDGCGIKEAKKLYDFCTLPGPRSLTMVVGNDTMRHWYTLHAHKDVNNALSFQGCDSQDNNHDILRSNSPLYKLSQLIEEHVQNPENLLRDAYTPLGDLLERLANSIEPHTPNPTLLDNTPYPLNATNEAPTGSSKELMIARCLHAFTFFKEALWFAKTDYDIQSHISHLEKILSFLAEHLNDEEGVKEKIVQMLSFIRKERPSNFIEIAFDHALEDLESLKNQIPASAYQNSLNTFKNMRTVYLNLDEISQAKSDLERNNVINYLTSSGGAEPGFSSGNDAEEAKKTLDRRINLILLTYQKAKLLNKFKEMTLRLGQGDPCLNGRMSAVEDFASSLAGLGQIVDTQATKVNLVPTTAFSAVLDTLLDDLNSLDSDEFIKDFSVENLKEPGALSIVIQQFSFWSARDGATPFLEFLVNQNLVDNVSVIDWESVIPKILNLPECVGWLNQAKATLIY